MAQIKKISDGKYLIRVSRGSGKRRQFVNITFYGTLAEARTEARDQETLLQSGRVANTRLKFDEYFRLWIKAVKPTLQPRTVDGYEGSITRYALTPLGTLKLRDIETHHIQRIYNSLEHLSATTVSNLHAALNACFGWGVRRDYIKSNPCKNTDRRKKQKPEITFLEDYEIQQFLGHCRTMPQGTMFEFALETGMRPEEYLALRWSDIRRNDVSVVRAVQYNRSGGGYYFKEIKTKSGQRRIPISEDLRLRLVQHRREQNEHRLKIKTWFNLDLVFPNIIGQPQELTNVSRRYFRPVLRAMWPPFEQEDGTEQPNSAAKPLTLYSLRHTMATLLLLAGTNPKIVSERLGHASVTLTLDTYSHVVPAMQDQATATLNNILRFRAG